MAAQNSPSWALWVGGVGTVEALAGSQMLIPERRRNGRLVVIPAQHVRALEKPGEHRASGLLQQVRLKALHPVFPFVKFLSGSDVLDGEIYRVGAVSESGGSGRDGIVGFDQRAGRVGLDIGRAPTEPHRKTAV